MKTLKKAAVIFMMLLLITTSFTYSVHADDDQTADDASSDTVEVIAENEESLPYEVLLEEPTEVIEEEPSEVIETDEKSEEASEGIVIEEITEEIILQI